MKYRASEVDDLPVADSPLLKNSVNKLAVSGERLMRNYSEAIKPVTVRVNHENSREISGKNSEASIR